MIRERAETIDFSRDDLERIVRYMAEVQLARTLFLGKFGRQDIAWTPDGGVRVITSYQQSSLDEIPTPAALPKRKR